MDEITSSQQLKNNVLLVLPGSDTHHAYRQSLGSYFSHMDRLLGNLPSVALPDVIVASYSSSQRTLDQTPLTNENEDYIDPHAMTLTSSMIMPALDEGKTLTLFGYSAGGILAENIRRSLVILYAERGLNEEMIAQKLRSVVLVSIANVSKAPFLAEGEKEKPVFTSVYFRSLDDKVAQRRVPEFASRRPANHKEGGFSITATVGNGLLFTTHSTPQLDIWKVNENKVELKRIGDHQYAHDKEFFILRNMVSPPGVVLAVERALCNAVTRSRPLDARSLVTLSPVNKPPNHSVSDRPSMEEIMLSMQLPPGRGRK